nr:BatD family protein [Halochromatium salexigens]
MTFAFVSRHERTVAAVAPIAVLAPLASLARRGGCLFVCLALLVLLPGSSLAAEVRASLDQTQVYEGERVLLTIEVAGGAAGGVMGRVSGEGPDLAPLDEDFEVAGINTSQQTQIVNGRRSDRLSWRITLLPKRVGQLEIPSIQVGSVATEPLSVQVDAVPEGGLGAPGDEVWLEVELGANGGWAEQPSPGESPSDSLVVQQQVPLVVRAYSARPLLDYAIEMPTLEDAVLTQIGRDRGHLVTREGQQYRVIERRYSLSPERSGTLRLPPIIFEAELETERARRSPGSLARDGLPNLFADPLFERMPGGLRFGPSGSLFERGEPARAQSGALVLEVAARAKDFSGEHWLPATALEIQDAWQGAEDGKTPQLVLGEPATRTLTVIAKGLAGNQIPEIEIPTPDGLRVYPGQTQTETRSDGETLIGLSRQQWTLIPTRAGEIELPRIEVPWWQTETGEERTATVPALALTVTGSVADAEVLEGAEEVGGGTGVDEAQADAQAQSAEGSGQADMGAAGAGEGDGAGAESDAGSGVDTDTGFWMLKRLWGLLFIALIALGVGLLWRHRRWLHGRWLNGRWLSRPATPASAVQGGARSSASNQARHSRVAVQSACERNDPKAAATALLAWAAQIWPDAPPSGLRALAERAERGGSAIRALERRLYGDPDGQADWQGEALWLAVKDGLGAQSASARTSDEPLAPLYPR